MLQSKFPFTRQWSIILSNLILSKWEKFGLWRHTTSWLQEKGYCWKINGSCEKKKTNMTRLCGRWILVSKTDYVNIAPGSCRNGSLIGFCEDFMKLSSVVFLVGVRWTVRFETNGISCKGVGGGGGRWWGCSCHLFLIQNNNCSQVRAAESSRPSGLHVRHSVRAVLPVFRAFHPPVI